MSREDDGSQEALSPPLLTRARSSTFDGDGVKATFSIPGRSLHDNLRPALEPIFPAHVVDAILSNQSIHPEAYRDVVVLFADIVGYTELCSALKPMTAHKLLHDFFMVTDYCISLFPTLYKVESIGDCVMVIGGAPQHLADCTAETCKLTLLLRSVVGELLRNPLTKEAIEIRVGINTGDVVGGVVGSLMPRYTFTGDAVNVTARMQALSEPGAITLSLSTALRLARAHRTLSPQPSAMSSRASSVHTSVDSLSEAQSLPGSPRAISRGNRNSSFVMKASEQGGRAEHHFFSRNAVDDLLAVEQGRLLQIDKGAELVLGDVVLVSGGLHQVKGKGPMQVFTLHQTSSPRDRSPTSRNAEAERLRCGALSAGKLASIQRAAEELIFRSPAMLEILTLPSLSNRGGDIRFNTNTTESNDALDGFSGLTRADSGTISEDVSTPSLPTAVPITRTTSVFRVASHESVIPEVASQMQQSVEATLTGLDVIILTESVLRGKMLRHAVRNLHGSWTIRLVPSYEDLVGDLKVGGFRCDLLIIDTPIKGQITAQITAQLKARFPKFFRRVVSVVLSNSSDDVQHDKEAARVGVDDCWHLPPPDRVVLKARILHRLLLKGRLKCVHIGKKQQKKEENDDVWLIGEGDTWTDTNTTSAAPPPRTVSPDPDFQSVFRSVASLRQVEMLAEVDPVSGSSSSSDDDANTCCEDLSSSSFSTVPSVESLAGSLSFLVVEDSPTQRKLIVRGLQQVSPLWSVESCADSKSALALLRSHKAFDVIFVDLNLGEGSLMGDALVRELRGPGCDFHAPVIIGLNRSRTDTEVRFIVSGADSAWAKPLPPKELISQRVEVLVAARKLMCKLFDAPIDTFSLTPTDQHLNALRAASVGTVDRSC